MKKPFIFLVIITFFTVSLFAQDVAKDKEPKAPPFAGQKGFHYFNTYFEWGFGDLMQNDESKRLISEFIEVKATYLYTFASVPWLSIGFGALYQTSPKWLGKHQPGLPSKNPRDGFLLTADFLLWQTLGLTVTTDGTVTPMLTRTVPLPDVEGLQSHNMVFLLYGVFDMKGGYYAELPVYDDTGTITGTQRRKLGGWFDRAELRIGYNMRFNDYVGLGINNVFTLMGIPFFHGGGFLDGFLYRFNPRLRFYAPGGWSFFVEPRFFYLPGVKDPSGQFATEIKVGMDYTFTAFQ